MATLRDIKNRMGSVKSIQKITQAMKMVSAAKLRKAQNQVESSRPYFQKLESNIVSIISSLEGEFDHPFIKARNEIKNIAAIVVSSDRGMCGSFNTNLLRETNKFLTENLQSNHPDAKISVLPIGRKAVAYFKKQNYPIIANFINISNNPDFNTFKDIIDPIKIGYLNNEYDLVYIFYVEFINIMKQEPSNVQLIPLEGKHNNEKVESDINHNSYHTNYIFEPDKESILQKLIPNLIDTKFWSTILESTAAEHAARRVAMDNATTNAGELIKSLNLIYNRVRQASITKEIIEIVSGANALKGN